MIGKPSFMSSPPPVDWVGKHETDGYEYIEYPIGSDNYWYRISGSQQWQQWISSQTLGTLNDVLLSGDSYSSQSFGETNNQYQTTQQDYTSYGVQTNTQPTAQTGYTPSSNLNQALAPPSYSPPLNYNYPPTNTVSFTTRNNNGGKAGKTLLFIILVPAIIIVLSGILYVWASSLAGDSSSDSYDNWEYDDGCDDNDSDCDGISDYYDNCVYDSNYNQDNFDGDSYGDVCDDDIDGDGHTNYNDFHDYGDGKLTFEWDYARIDDGETYDGDGSGPDVYAEVRVDYDKDGSTDATYYTETTDNIREWSNLGEITINPTDSRSSIKISVVLWDDDYGEDDVLDYAAGTGGNYYTYTISLSESTYSVKEDDGRDDDKGLKIKFIFDSFAD